MNLEKAQAEYDELHDRRYPDLSSEEKERYTKLAFVLLNHRGEHFMKLLKGLRTLRDHIVEDVADGCGEECPFIIDANNAIADAEEVEGI